MLALLYISAYITSTYLFFHRIFFYARSIVESTILFIYFVLNDSSGSNDSFCGRAEGATTHMIEGIAPWLGPMQAVLDYIGEEKVHQNWVQPPCWDTVLYPFIGEGNIPPKLGATSLLG